MRVDPGPAGEILEGEFRPGFFGGVLTVVLKLFSLVRPDTAVFGQKDAQQALVIRRLVRDLDLPVRIEVCPTIREADGLALSSRNKYLSAEERAIAPVLHRALTAGAAAATGGPGAVLAAARTVLEAATAKMPAGAAPRVDYLALSDASNYTLLKDNDFDFHGSAVLAVAARVGTTRLIDNVLVEFGTEPDAADD